VGRFAPSPSGELHLGSLYSATASYLDARANGGRWLVRMEDLDRPRVIAGSAARILDTLQAFGFEWDGEVAYQTHRTEAYAAALATLDSYGLTFQCSCSRSRLADEERYPGHCRDGPLLATAPTATRLRVAPGHILFTDRIQGLFRQEVAAAVGDMLLKRRDGIVAYVLAVVVDDAAQGVTDIVRGADLLDNTPRQMHLQRLLGIPPPTYAHVPVLTEPGGKKLAKSARSVHLDTRAAVPQLVEVFRLLGMSPPPELEGASLAEAWHWGVAVWRIDAVPKRLTRQPSA
jgi:glutamyl-Q tRNA(Asp) synthetase